EEDGAHFDLIYVRNGGSVEINGGTFICQTPRWTLNSRNDEPGTFVVNGGTFKDFNPAAVNTDDNVTTWCAEGYTATEGQDGYWTVAAIPVSNNVAKIGETEYETLEKAFEAAKDMAEPVTVTLLKDIEQVVTVPTGFNGTIDLGGKTVTGKFVLANSNAIIMNGSVYAPKGITDKAAIHITGGAVELNNLKVTSNYHVVRATGAVVEITGDQSVYTCIATGKVSYYIIYAETNGSTASEITIEDGTFSCERLEALVDGNIWKGEVYGLRAKNANDEIIVTGGVFDADYEKLVNSTVGKCLISDGKFKKKSNLEGYLASGYTVDSTVNSGYYTVVEKPAIVPSASVEVSAADAAAAMAKVEILIPEGVTDVDAATYANYFTKTATYNESTEKYTVTAALNPEVVTPKITAIGFDENGVTVTLENKLLGLYYAVRSAATVDKVDTDEATVTTGLNAPATGDAAFYRVLVDFAPIAATPAE
ncbi:MAG: hypothetical protein J6Q84_08860, partial [Kiritimatiellae bacterium]|nr:hypothetical protein [Kiritimatiellia bacterium]